MRAVEASIRNNTGEVPASYIKRITFEGVTKVYPILMPEFPCPAWPRQHWMTCVCATLGARQRNPGLLVFYCPATLDWALVSTISPQYTPIRSVVLTLSAMPTRFGIAFAPNGVTTKTEGE